MPAVRRIALHRFRREGIEGRVIGGIHRDNCPWCVDSSVMAMPASAQMPTTSSA